MVKILKREVSGIVKIPKEAIFAAQLNKKFGNSKVILEKLYGITKAPLTFFDIETTGLDKIQDDIVQIYLCF